MSEIQYAIVWINEGLGTEIATYALNLVFGDYFVYELCVHVWCIILDCLAWIGCGLVCGTGICVRETMPESAILAQASRTRLGEISGDLNNVTTRAFPSGEEF